MREGLKKVGRWLAAAAILTLINGLSIGLVRPDAAVIAGELTADIVGGAVALLFPAGAVALVIMDFGDKWLRARRRAHVTRGRVIGRSLESRVAENSTVYGAVVHVRYEVRGKLLELDWKPSSTTISIPWVVEYFLERKYPNGKELAVYYEWQDPENAWVGRARSLPLLTVPLVIAVLGFILALGYVSGSALRCATDGFVAAHWGHAKAFVSDVSPPVEQAAPVGVSTDSSATLTAEGAPRGATGVSLGDAVAHHDLCSCVAETKSRDERVQLTLAIADAEGNRRTGPFETSYRLHVGQAPALSLQAMQAGAPVPRVASRLVEMAMACTPDAAIIVQGEWATAWSLTEPAVMWNTRLTRSLNLLSGRAPDTGLSLVCRELPVKNGILSIPVGKAKSLHVRAGDGSVRGAGAGK